MVEPIPHTGRYERFRPRLVHKMGELCLSVRGERKHRTRPQAEHRPDRHHVFHDVGQLHHHEIPLANTMCGQDPGGLRAIIRQLTVGQAMLNIGVVWSYHRLGVGKPVRRIGKKCGKRLV